MKVPLPVLRIVPLLFAGSWLAGMRQVVGNTPAAWLPGPEVCFVAAYLGGAISAYLLSSHLETAFPPVAWALVTLLAPVIALPILACQKNWRASASPATSWQSAGFSQTLASPGIGCPFYHEGRCRTQAALHSEALDCSLQKGSYASDCNVFPVLAARGVR